MPGLRDRDLGPDWDEFCGGRLRNPYPVLAELRATDPVHWSERLDGWVVTRYDDVLAGLADPRLGNDRIAAYMGALTEGNRTAYHELGDHVAGWLGFTDPPKHTRLRGLVREFFTPALATRLRPTIENIVAHQIDGMPAAPEPVDLVSSLAFPLPAAIICEVLGIEADRRDEMKVLTDAIVPFTGNIGPSLNDVAGPAHEAIMELVPYFRGVVAQRLREPREDLITRLAFLDRENALRDDEILSLVVFTFVAGFETTTSGIANALMLLLSDQSERERLIREPGIAPSMVEETLRAESPIQMSVRVARESLEIGTREIVAGSTVLLLNGAANRDPAQFGHPDHLDIGRTPNRHLAFGWASHFCLGAPLARLEIQVAATALFSRFPEAHLAEIVSGWVPNMSIRCPTNVRVILGPPGG